MRQHIDIIVTAVLVVIVGAAMNLSGVPEKAAAQGSAYDVQLGPRPFFLVNDMENGALKASC
jgi:hypothetical protein